jgi:hypothetical protein
MKTIIEKIIPGVQTRERKEPPKRRCTASPTPPHLFSDVEPTPSKPRETDTFGEWSLLATGIFQRLLGRW